MKSSCSCYSGFRNIINTQLHTQADYNDLAKATTISLFSFALTLCVRGLVWFFISVKRLISG